MQIRVEKKILPKPMIGVSDNIHEITKKETANVTYLDFVKAGLIYRMSQ